MQKNCYAKTKFPFGTVLQLRPLHLAECGSDNSTQNCLSAQGRIFAAFGMRDKMVYLYDNNSCYGKLLFDNFLKIK